MKPSRNELIFGNKKVKQKKHFPVSQRGLQTQNTKEALIANNYKEAIRFTALSERHAKEDNQSKPQARY